MGTVEGHKHCSQDRVRKRSAGRQEDPGPAVMWTEVVGASPTCKTASFAEEKQDPGKATNKQLPSPSKSPRAPSCSPGPASWSPPTRRRVGRTATALTYRRNHVTVRALLACAWLQLPRRPSLYTAPQ